MLAHYHRTQTAHATTEQQRCLHTHFEQASSEDTATVAWGPNTTAVWRFHRVTGDTKHPAITFPVLANHCSTTPGAPAHPVKHHCSQVQDWQTIERATFHPQKVYLLQYVYSYLTQDNKGNTDYVHMKPAATEIIHQGIGVYATGRLQPATTTPSASTEQGAQVHAYQLTALCRLPCPDDRNTVIFADASGTRNLTPAAGGAAFELPTDTAVDYGNTTPRGPPCSGLSPTDAAVDIQIVHKLARQPLHKVTDSSLDTQALHLWVALQHLPKHVVLHLVKQEHHRYSLGNGHIDLHAHSKPAENLPDGEDLPLQDHMHTHLQDLSPIPHPGEPPSWVPDDLIYNDMGQAYHYSQPIRTMAHIRGSHANNTHMTRLQHELQTALYFSALDLPLLPVHL